MKIHCKHGQLCRSCDICELEAERDRLAAENKRLREALERCLLDDIDWSSREMARAALKEKS